MSRKPGQKQSQDLNPIWAKGILTNDLATGPLTQYLDFFLKQFIFFNSWKERYHSFQGECRHTVDISASYNARTVPAQCILAIQQSRLGDDQDLPLERTIGDLGDSFASQQRRGNYFFLSTNKLEQWPAPVSAHVPPEIRNLAQRPSSPPRPHILQWQ